MTTYIIPKIPTIYGCKLCDYETSNKKDYTKHLITRKHRSATNQQQTDNQNILYMCQHCKKEYRDRSGLWRHKTKCDYEENKVIESKQTTHDEIDHASLTEKMIELVMSKNQEFMTVFMEKIVHMLPSITNTTHTNSHNTNNQFNIQMFLNDHCKNAMNISDFIKSLPITAKHYENTKDNGLADTLTTLMVDGLNNLNVVERPIHCTDQKRKIMYVKDNDKWEKDTNNEIVVKGVKDLTFLHRMNVDLWQEENPKFNTDDDLQIALSSIICNLFSNVTDEKKDLAKLFKGLTDATYLDEDTKTNFTTCDTLASV